MNSILDQLHANELAEYILTFDESEDEEHKWRLQVGARGSDHYGEKMIMNGRLFCDNFVTIKDFIYYIATMIFLNLYYLIKLPSIPSFGFNLVLNAAVEHNRNKFGEDEPFSIKYRYLK